MFKTSFILFYYRVPTSYERLQGNFKPFFLAISNQITVFTCHHFYENFTLRHSHAFSQNHINCSHMYSYVFALSMDYTKSTKPLRNMMCEAEFLDLLLCQFKIW